MQAYEEVYLSIKELGANLVAVSPMLSAFISEFREELGITFPILCDRSNRYASRLDLTYIISNNVREVYKQSGIALPFYNGNESWDLPVTATFIVDIEGIIRFAWKETDHTKRPEPEYLVDFLKQMKTSGFF